MIVVCPICGKEFEKLRGEKRVYCSPECARIAGREASKAWYHRNAEDIAYRKKMRTLSEYTGRRIEMLELEQWALETGYELLEKYSGDLSDLQKTAEAAYELSQSLSTLIGDAKRSVGSKQDDAAVRIGRLRGAVRALAWIASDLDYKSEIFKQQIEGDYNDATRINEDD